MSGAAHVLHKAFHGYLAAQMRENFACQPGTCTGGEAVNLEVGIKVGSPDHECCTLSRHFHQLKRAFQV